MTPRLSAAATTSIPISITSSLKATRTIGSYSSSVSRSFMRQRAVLSPPGAGGGAGGGGGVNTITEG